MNQSPPRRRGDALSPRASQSYLPEQADASGPPEKHRRGRSPEVFQARVLACIALMGPMRVSGIRAIGWMTGPTATELYTALSSLVSAGLVEAAERSEIAVLGDGIRCRVDCTLFSLARPGGEP